MTDPIGGGQPLPRAFYEQPTVQVARALLGHTLVRRLPSGEVLSGTIVETEAYPHGDPALYAYLTPNPRTQMMFGPAGHVYIYATYRIHLMLNIVCGQPGIAESILIRALEPVAGIDVMRAHRPTHATAAPHTLTNGPGKLTAALGLTVDDFLGVDVTNPHSPLQVLPPLPASLPHDTLDFGDDALPVKTTTRIGLTRGADLPYRFYIIGNPCVSRS